METPKKGERILGAVKKEAEKELKNGICDCDDYENCYACGDNDCNPDFFPPV